MKPTISWLQQKIEEMESQRDEAPFGISDDHDMTLEVMKMALAGMEAEPVYQWRDAFEEGAHWDDCTKEQYAGFCIDQDCETRILYTAPQPLTISERAELENYRNAQQVVLTVWYGAMPESNGRTNWSAILHQKGKGILDGMTIDRSEYPGRVLYAADRVRYLIGEKPDRPHILDYDADEHSGYIAPQSGAGKDGWVACSERMPEESGRYWCYVEEQNSLGKSCYQWNCSWNGDVWGGEMMHGRVTHWQPLPEAPQQEVK
ncbi:DUF551 domain-containing protein [Enterobacter hormaechei]|uniref:DUF551 domain-containing protein n=1 Tax=Enterobacter hormaechei TaxID=158836 RepID=UPI0039C4C37D